MGERDAETSAELVQHLEDASGRKLRTREDVRRLLEEMSARTPAENPATRLWGTAKQGICLLLLVGAFLQYYFLDILVEINSLPEIRVSVPVTLSQSSRAIQF
jgi:hypothetical protein